MAENDFYVINGNRYRGSRYSNFQGGGVDAQGNVSSAVNENSANNVAQSGNRPTTVNTDIEGSDTRMNVDVPAGATTGGIVPQQNTTRNMIIGSAVPAAGQVIGSAAGTALATGGSFGEALKMGASGAINKVSGGLLGTASNPTNSALASMGGKFGPATQSAVGKASAGAGLGGAAGSGIGTAVATLLTGGSMKDAAVSGLGAAAGYAIGNAILPGPGGFIGSFLGSNIGKVLGFGGKEKRATLSATVGVNDDGTYGVRSARSSTLGVQKANKYGTAITDVLNAFAKSVGLKYKKNFYTETNVGKVDAKTTLGMGGAEYGGKVGFSKKKADIDGLTLRLLRDPTNYKLGDNQDVNNFFTESVGKAKSAQQLGEMLDNFLNNRANGPSPSLISLQNTGKSRYNFAS